MRHKSKKAVELLLEETYFQIFLLGGWDIIKNEAWFIDEEWEDKNQDIISVVSSIEDTLYGDTLGPRDAYRTPEFKRAQARYEEYKNSPLMKALL